jgi:MFS-type transporter involved in bile tolerance (Atg22 family)
VGFFILANYAYQGALVFYNALLPDVAGPENIGRVSGFGVSLGYLGAIVGLLMVMPFAQGEISFLHLELPFFQKDWQTVAVLSVDENAHLSQFLDDAVEKDANYRYRLAPDSTFTRNEPGWNVTSKDTVIQDAGGRAHRAIKILLPDLPQWKERKLVLLRQESGWGRRGTFIPTAVLFFLFSLPTFIFVREKRRTAPKKRLRLREAVQRVWDGLVNTRKYPGVLRFLIAKFFYEEGIQTSIIFMAVYAVKVMGFPNEMIILFFIITTTAAAVGSLIFGYVTDWLRPKRTLLLVVSGWVLSLLAIISTNSHTIFWIIGSVVGVLMGSTWTAARPLLISLVPEEMVAEFFGLYALSGKVAAIFGPLVWGAAVFLFKPYGDVVRYKAAVLSLALMMALGLILLWKVPAGTLDARGNPETLNK